MTSSPFNAATDRLSPVRLGAISFVNTIPVYSAYVPDAGVDLIYDVPARLNAKMLAGALDLSPVSSACYLRHPERFVLLNDLSVSSPGAVESVLFLSRRPLGPEMLDMPAIQVPNDSETSVMLLAWLLQNATGRDFRPWFQIYEATDYPSALANAGNALIIGDNALMMKERLASLNEPLYCYDLSGLWVEKTGLPFVFAVWVANIDWASRHPERLQAVSRDLRAARGRFFDEPDAFAAGLARARERSGLPAATLERYYRQCLTYGLTPAHHQSLRRFETILHAADRAPLLEGAPLA